MSVVTYLIIQNLYFYKDKFLLLKILHWLEGLWITDGLVISSELVW